MEEIDFMAAPSCSQHCEPASPSQQRHFSNTSHSGSDAKLASTKGPLRAGLRCPWTLLQPLHRLPCSRKEVASNIHMSLTGLFPVTGGHSTLLCCTLVVPVEFQDVSGKKGEQTADTSRPHAWYWFIQANFRNS